MTTLEDAVLWLHIAAGAVAVATGLGALLTKKGGRVHVRSGRLFLGAMAIVISTIFVLTVIDPTTFRLVLTLVGVLTAYFVITGYRHVKRKMSANDARSVDWAVVGALGLVSIGLLGWGMWVFIAGNQFGIAMAAFGGIGIGFSYRDLQRFRTGTPNEQWMSEHLTGMIGAYIATVTAVSATNLHMLPTAVAWLWPTVVGVPLIWYFPARHDGAGPLASYVSG